MPDKFEMPLSVTVEDVVLLVSALELVACTKPGAKAHAMHLKAEIETAWWYVTGEPPKSVPSILEGGVK